MAKNNYAAILQAKKQVELDLAYQQGHTHAMVMAVITMYDALGVGAKRLERFCEEFNRTRKQVEDMMAIDPAYAEAVLQRKLEQILPGTNVKIEIGAKGPDR